MIPVPPAEQAGGLKPNELLRRHLYRLQVLVELEQLQRKDLMKVCVLYTSSLSVFSAVILLNLRTHLCKWTS